jgi:hypothetical protein
LKKAAAKSKATKKTATKKTTAKKRKIRGPGALGKSGKTGG